MATYVYYCSKCGKTLEIQQGMNDEHSYTHCGTSSTRIFTPFYTDKDLLYNFDTNIFGRKTKFVHSRTQYKRLLKSNGMVDATVRECLQVKPSKDPTKYSRYKVAKRITERLHQDGIAKHVGSFAKRYFVKKEK